MNTCAFVSPWAMGFLWLIDTKKWRGISKIRVNATQKCRFDDGGALLWVWSDCCMLCLNVYDVVCKLFLILDCWLIRLYSSSVGQINPIRNAFHQLTISVWFSTTQQNIQKLTLLCCSWHMMPFKLDVVQKIVWVVHSAAPLSFWHILKDDG